MILREGKNRVRDLLEADIENGEYGTGTTAPTAGDTDTGTQVADTEVETTNTKSDKLIQIVHENNHAMGNGSSLTEFTTWCNSGSTLLTRNIFSSYAKSNIKTMTATKFIFIN